MEKYKIESNPCNGGYRCDFTVKGKKFYADICFTLFSGSECMIFEYDEDGDIDWSGVYTQRHVSVNKESLIKCIEEFKEEIFH